MDSKKNMDKKESSNRFQKKKKQPQLSLDDISIEKSVKLKRLRERNLTATHVNRKIFYILHDPYTFADAYARISKSRVTTIKASLSNDTAMDHIGQTNAITLANKFKTDCYSFNPVRKTFTPKLGKKKKEQTMNISNQEDRIVQEVIRGILEAIYEPEFAKFEIESKFKATNFGSRPNKNCFDAVKNFKIHSQACIYVLNGSIKSSIKSVDHATLLNILNRRIKDKKFLDLIKHLLSNGIMEENVPVHSLAGVYQGKLLSSLLFNIYMFEFDKFMYKVVQKYDSSSRPQQNLDYKSIEHRIEKLLSEKPKGYGKELRKLVTQKLATPFYKSGTISNNPIFIRYSENWLFGIRREKQVVKRVKEIIRRFLQNYLRVKLDLKKTSIFHYQKEKISFLGYEIKMWTPNQLLVHKRLVKTSKGYIRVKEKSISRKITVRPSKKLILRNLVQKGICKEDGFPIGVRSWTMLEEFRIVERYRSIMIGIADYYVNCDNLYALNQISYILQYSCAKTIATRKRITMSQVFHRYGNNLQIERPLQSVRSNHNSKTRSIKFLTFKDLKVTGFIEERKHKESARKINDPFKFSYISRSQFKV